MTNIFTARRNSSGLLKAGFSKAAIFIHGRGGSAAQFLTLAEALLPPEVAAFAPQAESSTWYPYSFMAAFEANQPGIDNAHQVIEQMIVDLEKKGVLREQIALIGFSQGACVVADHLYRFPSKYAAAISFIGGLIGPPETEYPVVSGEPLKQTPVLLAAGDRDPHVPWQRVSKTAQVLRALGATVTVEQTVDAGHEISQNWIEKGRQLLATASC